MLQSNNQRIAYLDILRLLATFAVIFIHITADGLPFSFMQYNWYVAVVGGSLVRWAVPVFVMISGALYLNPHKEITTGLVLKKKIPRLLLAYVAWWLIYALAIVTVWCLIKKEPFQTEWIAPHYHLWFLPMLAGVFLLIPLLRPIAANEKLLRYALVIWLCYLACSFAFVKEIKQITPLFAMNTIVGYAGYFLLGYFLSTLETSKRQRIVIYILGILGALVTIGGSIGLSAYTGAFNEKFYAFLSLHVAMMSMALFVFVKDKALHVGHRTQRLLEIVRYDLFGVYLTHDLWLMVLNKDVVRDLTNHALTLPLICLVTFVLSLYTTKLIRKIPFLKHIVA